MNRDDFPLLRRHPELIYLDNANTTLKPQRVIDAVSDYYYNYSGNIGRTSHDLSEAATRAFNDARQTVAGFVGCKADEIIFTYSTTYALNQVARGIQHLLQPGDIILLTYHEHNSNLLVWQDVAGETGAEIRFVEELFEDANPTDWDVLLLQRGKGKRVAKPPFSKGRWLNVVKPEGLLNPANPTDSATPNLAQRQKNTPTLFGKRGQMKTAGFQSGVLSRIKIFSYSITSNVTGRIYDYNDIINQLPADTFVAVDASQLAAHRPLAAFFNKVTPTLFGKKGQMKTAGFQSGVLLNQKPPLVKGAGLTDSSVKTGGLSAQENPTDSATPNLPPLQGGKNRIRSTSVELHRPPDFISFGSHKVYGPNGVGVLYIRQDIQKRIAPLVYGSQTFTKLDDQHFELLTGPARFEPGTPNIEGVIGLSAALKYLQSIGWDKIERHETELIQAYRQIAQELKLDNYVFRNSPVDIGVAALVHPSVHPHDIAMIMNDRYHIAVRAGKSCADLVAEHYHQPQGVLRASFSIYNTANEIRQYLTAYRQIINELE